MKNIVFKKISITNFLSFGKTQTYSFDDGITLVCGQNNDKGGDPNGSGKSTIFDALSFALFGKTMKSLTTSNLVNRIAKKNGVVELDMEIDGKPFSIIRGVKPSFAKVVEDGKEKQFAGIKPTDQYVADKIGTDYTTFRNTVMMTSNNTPPFLQQNAETKRKFIESLFNIEFVREMINIWKEENAAKATEYKEVGLQMDSANSALERFKQMHEAEKMRIAQNIEIREEQFKKALENYDAVKSEFESMQEPPDRGELELEKKRIFDLRRDAELERERASRQINAANGRKLKAERDVEVAKKFIEDTENWINRVNDGLKERGYEEDFWTMYNSLSKYEDELKDAHHRSAEELAIPKANTTLIDSLLKQKSELLGGDKCPTCGHVFTEEEKKDTLNRSSAFDSKISVLRKEISASKDRLNGIYDEIRLIEAKIKVANAGVSHRVSELESTKNSLASLNKELSDATEEYDLVCSAFDVAEKNLQDIQKKSLKVCSDLDVIEHEISVYNSRKNAVSRAKMDVDAASSLLDAAKNEKPSSDSAIEEFTEKVEALEEKSKKIEDEIEVYACAKKVLGDDGYRAELVSRIVTALNAKANEYLQKLDAPVTISVDKFFTDNIVDILTGEVIVYDSLSGGEQRRVDLAMLLAFMDIRSMQGDAKFYTQFFDEILDSALSQHACCKLMEILKDKHDNDDVSSIVITHRKELLDNDNVGNKLLVTKVGGISSIERL